MRWLKHLTHARQDEKMAIFWERHRALGYGVWWAILETIAAAIEPSRESCSLSKSEHAWAELVGCETETWRKVVGSLASLSLVHLSNSKEGRRTIQTVSVPNLLKYRDEYSSRYRGKSGEHPDSYREQSRERADREQNSVLPAVTVESRRAKNPAPNGAKSQYPDIPAALEAIWSRWRKPGPRLLAEQYLCEEISRGSSVEIIIAGLERWVAYYDSSGQWSYCHQNLAQAIHDRAWEVEPPAPLRRAQPIGSNEQQKLNAGPQTEYISAKEWARLYPEAATDIERRTQAALRHLASESEGK